MRPDYVPPQPRRRTVTRSAADRGGAASPPTRRPCRRCPPRPPGTTDPADGLPGLMVPPGGGS